MVIADFESPLWRHSKWRIKISWNIGALRVLNTMHWIIYLYIYLFFFFEGGGGENKHVHFDHLSTIKLCWLIKVHVNMYQNAKRTQYQSCSLMAWHRKDLGHWLVCSYSIDLKYWPVVFRIFGKVNMVNWRKNFRGISFSRMEMSFLI